MRERRQTWKAHSLMMGQQRHATSLALYSYLDHTMGGVAGRRTGPYIREHVFSVNAPRVWSDKAMHVPIIFYCPHSSAVYTIRYRNKSACVMRKEAYHRTVHPSTPPQFHRG